MFRLRNTKEESLDAAQSRVDFGSSVLPCGQEWIKLRLKNKIYKNLFIRNFSQSRISKPE